MAQTDMNIAPTIYSPAHPPEDPPEEHGGFTTINLCNFIRALEMIEIKSQNA